MKCQNCGSELTFSEGLYVCANCGNRFHPSVGVDLPDVFIAYIENDATGRRTRDSIICNTIYNELKNANIKTFYEKVDLSDLWGDAYNSTLHQAFDSAKIIILFATNTQNFNTLLDKYEHRFIGKKLLPVFSDMDASALPSALINIQSLNLGNIGALKDLKNNVLVALGRGAQIDTVSLSSEKENKRKRIIAILSAASILAVVISVIVIIFATPLVLPSKKLEKAEKLYDSQQYSKAITLLSTIPQYNNATNLLSAIYTNYSGYYHDNESNISLHIVFSENSKATIEITHLQTEGVIKITETAQFTGAEIELNYNDSLNNTGFVHIDLENEGLSLTITPDSAQPENVYFSLSDKSDKPQQNKITAETILSWLEKKTTDKELKALGYDITHLRPLYKDAGSSLYRIDNTEIELAMFDYDISLTDSFYSDEFTESEDLLAFAYSAPAEILIPDKIGQTTRPFVEGDILYLPNHTMSQSYRNLDFYVPNSEEKNIITSDMQVCCTSKSLHNEVLWDYYIDKYIDNYGKDPF